MNKRLKCKFIVCRADAETVEMNIKFDCADGTYFFEELSLHDFKGDTPDQIADSLQRWVDHLRTVGKIEKDGVIMDAIKDKLCWPSESRFRDMEPGIVIFEPHKTVMPKSDPIADTYTWDTGNLAVSSKETIVELVEKAKAARPIPKPIDEVVSELERANGIHGNFKSTHDGWAILYEEVTELWDEVRANDPVKQRFEAVQVAAMGLKFINFLDGRKEKP